MQKIHRTVLRTLAITLLLLGLAACGDPFFYFSGGRLSGEETRSFKLPSSSGILQLETLPSDPYSVNIGFVLRDGQVYIDPALDRQWYQNILLDPRVRVRFDGSELVYPMLSVRETDPVVLAQFDPERVILRLEPR